MSAPLSAVHQRLAAILAGRYRIEGELGAGEADTRPSCVMPFIDGPMHHHQGQQIIAASVMDARDSNRITSRWVIGDRTRSPS